MLDRHAFFTAAAALAAASFLNCAEAQAPAAQCGDAQRARDAATVRIVFDEILSQGRIAENEHIYAPDFVAHGLPRDAGRAEDRAASEGWRQAAPDLRMIPLRIAADCDLVAVHWEATGTNTGEGNGLPATGRAITAQGVTFFGMRDGKIAEEWTVFDQYTMLRQLGLLSQ